MWRSTRAAATLRQRTLARVTPAAGIAMGGTGDAPPRRDNPIELRVLRFTVRTALSCFRALRFLPAIIVVSTIGAWFFVRGTLAWNADGDEALHLALIKQIASTHRLPAVLPHLPARIAEGGAVEASFPYAYTPLYHATGAIMYTIAGVNGVLAINAVSAAVIGYVIFALVRRSAPWPIAIVAAVAAFISPYVQLVFSGIYMEPMELALLCVGAWLMYVTMVSRRLRPADPGRRRSRSVDRHASKRDDVRGSAWPRYALDSLYPRGSLTRSGVRREIPWLATLSICTAVVAAPFLLVPRLAQWRHRLRRPDDSGHGKRPARRPNRQRLHREHQQAV